jgi:hypothetical protein
MLGNSAAFAALHRVLELTGSGATAQIERIAA